MNDAFTTLGNEAAVPDTLLVDAELMLDELSEETLWSLSHVAPYGAENPKPLFSFKQITPTAVSRFGKGKEHTKLQFDTRGIAQEAIAFFPSA